MRSNFWSLVFIRTTFSHFHCEVKTTDLQAPCQWTGHGPMAGGNEGAMGLGIFTVQPWHSTRYVLKNLLFCVVEALLGRRLKCVVAWVGTVIRCGTRGTRLLACSLGSCWGPTMATWTWSYNYNQAQHYKWGEFGAGKPSKNKKCVLPRGNIIHII